MEAAEKIYFLSLIYNNRCQLAIGWRVEMEVAEKQLLNSCFWLLNRLRKVQLKHLRIEKSNIFWESFGTVGLKTPSDVVLRGN